MNCGVLISIVYEKNKTYSGLIKTQAYKHQAKKLLNDSAPVHGIGIQAHFGKKTSPEVLAVSIEMNK